MLIQITDPEFIYGSKTQELIISFYDLDLVPMYYTMSESEEDIILIDALQSIQIVVPIAFWEEQSQIKIQELINLGKLTFIDFKDEGNFTVEKEFNIKKLKKYPSKIKI